MIGSCLLTGDGEKWRQAKIEVHTLYIYWYKSQSAIMNRDTFRGIDLPFSSTYLSICCSSLSWAFDFLLDIGKLHSYWTLNRSSAAPGLRNIKGIRKFKTFNVTTIVHYQNKILIIIFFYTEILLINILKGTDTSRFIDEWWNGVLSEWHIVRRSDFLTRDNQLGFICYLYKPSEICILRCRVKSQQGKHLAKHWSKIRWR